MGWNDECSHHNLAALILMYKVVNDVCSHHNLLKEEKEGGFFNYKDLVRLVKNLNKRSRNILCLQKSIVFSAVFWCLNEYS